MIDRFGSKFIVSFSFSLRHWIRIPLKVGAEFEIIEKCKYLKEKALQSKRPPPLISPSTNIYVTLGPANKYLLIFLAKKKKN